MLKSSGEGPSTKEIIVEAALETLRTEGFARASARNIARRGGFNQALIFYHFGTINQLLLAALDESSARRMKRYREVMTEPGTLEHKIELAAELYREDLSSGHITVLSEIIAGSLDNPELGAQIVKRIDPWIDFAESVIGSVMGSTPIAGIAPPRTIAFAVVAMYLGVDLLAQLDKDLTRADSLFEMAKTGAGIAAAFLGPAE